MPYQGGLIVGEWAKRRADQQPGRVVVSAKSWLSNSSVDRSGNILPWKADDGVACCSPLIASAMYLTHLRKAFEQRYPDAGEIARPVAHLRENRIGFTALVPVDQV